MATATKAKTQKQDLIESIATASSNLTEAKALKRAKELGENVSANYFELGAVLSCIRKNGWYKNSDHKTFPNFVANEFNISVRRCYYLIDLYEKAIKVGVTWAQIEPVGWRKFTLIADKIKDDGSNLEEMLALAKATLFVDLETHVKNMGKPDSAADAPAKTTTAKMSFSLHEDQLETVNIALEKSKEQASTEFDSVALETICLQYLEGTTGKPAVNTKDVKAFIAQIGVDKVVAALPQEAILAAISMEAVYKELGYEKVLEVFDKVFPEIDVTVSVPG